MAHDRLRRKPAVAGQPGVAGQQGPGLAGACGAHDEQRAAAVGHDFPLAGVSASGGSGTSLVVS